MGVVREQILWKKRRDTSPEVIGSNPIKHFVRKVMSEKKKDFKCAQCGRTETTDLILPNGWENSGRLICDTCKAVKALYEISLNLSK